MVMGLMLAHVRFKVPEWVAFHDALPPPSFTQFAEQRISEQCHVHVGTCQSAQGSGKSSNIVHTSPSSHAGASEARNLGYMTRLGLWGEGVPAFPDFATFLDAMDSKGVAAFELVAMDMKVRDCC